VQDCLKQVISQSTSSGKVAGVVFNRGFYQYSGRAQLALSEKKEGKTKSRISFYYTIY